MVLNKLLVLGLVLAGCNQSLFDNGGGGNGDGGLGDGGDIDSPPVPISCPAPCVGDAGGDFNGTAGGANGRWRYLDDTRNRAWTPMSGTQTKTGAGMNKIAACADNPTAPACVEVPGALLFTSTGISGTADPAIELTTPDARVVQLSLRVHVPAGGNPQAIRLYRQAREDALYSAVATAGTTLEHAIVVDALAGDRFLLAVAPNGSGAADVAVQMFASETGEAFPKICHLAVGFEAAQGNTVANLCGSDVLTSWDELTTSVEVAPVLVAGPFPEQGTAADFVEGRYYDSTRILARVGDSTMQLWLKHEAFVSGYNAIPLSDLDLDDDDAGGIAIELYEDVGSTKGMRIGTCKMYTPTIEFIEGLAPYPSSDTWHFLRVVQKGDVTSVCLDGAKVMELAIPAGTAVTSYVPRIGKNSRWNPAGSYFDGQIDDVRLFTTALPCE